MKQVIDGIRYHVDTCGNGFPLVLLHGFTGDSTTWTPFFNRWGNHSSLFALDIIGHGKSDAPDYIEHYLMLRAAEDLYKILEKNQFEQVDILGYSMGGRLALTFAVKYPEKVRKLILESASPGLETLEERQYRLNQDKKLAQFIRQNGIGAFVEYWENIPLFESQKALSGEILSKIRNQRLNNSIKGLTNSLIGMGTGSQPSWWNELENLTVETLLITGEKDTKFCRIAEKMKKRLKDSTWIAVENCGHAIHVEKPEKFGTIISGFLSEVNGQ